MIVWLSDKWRLMNALPEVKNGQRDLFTDKMNNADNILQWIDCIATWSVND